MPDPSIFTIIGTLGGAALGATAALTAPLLLHRRQARERLEQEARLTQREQEQAQREEEWRRRELQLEIDRDNDRNREAMTRRLIKMRATTREFQEFLTKTFITIADGGAIGLDEFESGLDGVHAALNSAFDEALLDGLWFAHAREAVFLTHPIPGTTPLHGVLAAMSSKDTGVNATDLVGKLMEASSLVRQCAKEGPPIPDELRTETERALFGSITAREALVAYIQERLDTHGPETPQGPAGTTT